MPITQKDMRDVIIAGLNYKTAYENVLDIIQRFDSRFPENFEWLTFRLEALQPFTTAIKDATLLQTKYAYYRQNWRPNERQREQKRRKRAALNPLPPPIPLSVPSDPSPLPLPPGILPAGPAGPKPAQDDDAFLEEFNRLYPPPPKPA